MNLYQQGKLTDQQLARLCASIQELDHDVQNRETQLQETKNEVYPANQFMPAATPDYTPPTSSPATPSKAGAYQAPGDGTPVQVGPDLSTALGSIAHYFHSWCTKWRAVCS